MSDRKDIAKKEEKAIEKTSVLKLHLPKSEAAKPRQIDINAA